MPPKATGWYYVDKGERSGPFGETEMRRRIVDGLVGPDTLVWKEGMDDWKPLIQADSGLLGRETRMAASGSRPLPVLRPSPAPKEAPAVAASTAPGAVPTEVCGHCHNRLPQREMSWQATVWICNRCRPAFLARVKEGERTLPGRVVAGPTVRFAALAIDLALFSTVLYLFNGMSKDASLAALKAHWKVLLPVFGVYVTILTGRFGATVGKLALRLKIVDLDGTQIDFTRAFLRFLASILSVVSVVGVLVAMLDKETRFLHDRLCGTRVVKA